MMTLGHGVSHTVPIHRRLAGRDLTKDMTNTITEQEYSFTATAEMETVRDVKEKLRFSGLDYDTELHELPGGNIIIVGAKRFRCAEALFQRVSLATRFHDTLFLSKTKCHVYIRKEVYATVMLSSGTTCGKGIIVRMTKELTTLAPSKMEIKALRVSLERFDIISRTF